MTSKFATLANKHMLERDMRVCDFYKSLGLSKNDYMRYCEGDNPQLQRAIRMARVMGLKVEDIWG